MKVTILGTGAFGIALARILEKNENEVVMWTKFKEERDILKLTRENAKTLKGVKIPNDIEITSDISEAINYADLVIIAVPMKIVRKVAREIKDSLKENQVICIVSKGIEENTEMFLTEVVKEETNHGRICVMSGPNFAIDVAKFEPTAFTIAGEEKSACKLIQVCFENDRTKIEITHDVLGVQVGGALKNVYAISTGMLDGMGYNESTRAAFVTTALKEMTIFSRAFDSYRDTIYTYSGVGDMLLTCMSQKSRNYKLGKLMGQGMTFDDAKEAIASTLEGVETLEAINSIIKKNNMRLPILQTIYNIIKNGADKKLLIEAMVK